MDDTAEALPAIEQVLARHGVTGYFPTTVTAPMDATLSALERLADAIEKGGLDLERQNAGGKIGARPLGIHLGVRFISHSRRGVQPAVNLLAPTLPLFAQLWQSARVRIRLM